MKVSFKIGGFGLKKKVLSCCLVLLVICVYFSTIENISGYNETRPFDDSPKKSFILGNSAYNERSAQIHNGIVTWVRWTENPSEIYVYNGTHTIRVTNNDFDEFSPQIYNNRICWGGFPSEAPEIYYYNGSKLLQLTNDKQRKTAPQIDQHQVVWVTQVPSRYTAIYSFNGSNIKLVHNTTWIEHFHISKGKMVWQETDGSDLEIFYYNGSHTTQITDNDLTDYHPINYGGKIAWLEGNQPETRINMYEEGVITQLPHEIWNYDLYGIDSETILFTGHGDENSFVFLFDGEKIHQVSTTTNEASEPTMHRGQIVWIENPDKRVKGEELVFYNGSRLMFTDNSYTDYYQDIHAGQVVWERYRNNIPFDVLYTSFNKSTNAIPPVSEIDSGLSLEQFSGQIKPPKSKPLNISLYWELNGTTEYYAAEDNLLHFLVKGVRGNPMANVSMYVGLMSPEGSWRHGGKAKTDVNGTCMVMVEFDQIGEWTIRCHGGFQGYDPTIFYENVTIEQKPPVEDSVKGIPHGNDDLSDTTYNDYRYIILSAIVMTGAFFYNKNA